MFTTKLYECYTFYLHVQNQGNYEVRGNWKLEISHKTGEKSTWNHRPNKISTAWRKWGCPKKNKTNDHCCQVITLLLMRLDFWKESRCISVAPKAYSQQYLNRKGQLFWNGKKIRKQKRQTGLTHGRRIVRTSVTCQTPKCNPSTVRPTDIQQVMRDHHSVGQPEAPWPDISHGYTALAKKAVKAATSAHHESKERHTQLAA